MNKNYHPAELAALILQRSTCAVQVGAVLVDKYGIFGWGWNSMGPSGYGEHAEVHALGRCNRRRLKHATMWVAARRLKSHNSVLAKPCEACQHAVREVGKVMYRTKEGVWISLRD